MSARPFLARVAAEAGRPEGAERLRASLERSATAAATATPGLELAWHAPADAAAPGSERVVCVIDGTVDGVDALAGELGVHGDEAIVLAHGYERLGEGVLDRLRGAFTVLLWDRRARAGIVARDQLGGRPLHHREEGGALLVGSEIRDILPVAAGPPAPDRTALAHWLARRPPPGERTLFDGISRLGAGRLLDLGTGRAEVRRWWEPRYRDPEPIDRNEAVARLREGMTRAVARSLGGGANPGIMLSGGLDSACVAGLARQLGSPARAYSQVFPSHARIDESEEIALLEEQLGIQVRRHAFSGGSALAAGEEYARRWALPPTSPNWFVWEPLYEIARDDGIDVMLDGEGGDELFGCSPRLVADLLASGRLLDAIAQARRIPGMGADPPPRRIVRAIAQYGLRAALPRAIHGGLRRARNRGRDATPWLTDEARGLLDSAAEGDAWKALEGPRWWAALAYSLIDGPDRMAAADEHGRAGGPEGFDVAHPWRDLELVELVLSLPPRLAFDPDLDRPLARDAVRELIPEDIRLSDRKPIFNELLEDALSGPDAERLPGIVDHPGGRLAWALDPAGVEGVAGPARALVEWRIAAASLWARQAFG